MFSSSFIYWLACKFRKRTITLFLILLTAWPTNAAPVVIAALGDSLIQGYGLPAKKGFVPQLQNWLRETGADVTILNAGVSGDTTAGGLSRVAWTLTPEIGAMIVTLGGNDLLRGIDPAISRKNLAGILQAAKERGLPVLLIGLIAPGNYGPAYKTAFDAIYVDLATKYDVLIYKNFFSALMDTVDQKFPNPKFMQNDNIHPNAKGVAKIAHAIGPKALELMEQIPE